MELVLIIIILALGITFFIVLKQCKKEETKLNAEIENKNLELLTKIEENDKLHSDLERFSGIVSIEDEIVTKKKKLNDLQATAITFNKDLTDLKKLAQEIVSIEDKIKTEKKKLNDLQSTVITINEDLTDLKKLHQKIDRLKQLQQFEQKELSELKAKASNLNYRYTNAKSIFKELENDIKLYQNDLEFVELGVYEPIFDIETSEKYQNKITEIVTNQKQLIKGGNACVCETEWVVGNSRKQGEIMTRRYINLTLRAFNGECDSLISKVRWNNVKRFEERITKAFNTINKLGKSNNTFITDRYPR